MSSILRWLMCLIIVAGIISCGESTSSSNNSSSDSSPAPSTTQGSSVQLASGTETFYDTTAYYLDIVTAPDNGYIEAQLTWDTSKGSVFYGIIEDSDTRTLANIVSQTSGSISAYGRTAVQKGQVVAVLFGFEGSPSLPIGVSYTINWTSN